MTKDTFARQSALIVGSIDEQWNALGSIARWFRKATASLNLTDDPSVRVAAVDGSRIERATVREARQALADLLLEPDEVSLWAGDIYSTNLYCWADLGDGDYRVGVKITSPDRLVADGLHEDLQRFFKSKRTATNAASEPRAPVTYPTVPVAAPARIAPTPQRTAITVPTGEGATAKASAAGAARPSFWNNRWVLGIGTGLISGIVLLLLGLLLPR